MRTQSAITTAITHAVTVAGGVFAPGHLGELTQYLPFELVDDVLAETKTVQRRLRALPSRAGVYFVLALGMFPHLGYLRVWGKLTAGLAGLDLPRPSRDIRPTCIRWWPQGACAVVVSVSGGVLSLLPVP